MNVLDGVIGNLALLLEETRVTTSKVEKIEEVEEEIEPPGETDTFSVASSMLKEKQKEKPIQDRFTDRDIEISVKVALECPGNGVKILMMLNEKGVNLGTFQRIMNEFNEMRTSVAAAAFKKQFHYNDPSLDDDFFAILMLKRKVQLKLVEENQLSKPVEQRIPDEHFEDARQVHLAMEKDREHGFSTWLSENFERANLESLDKIKEEMDALNGTVPCEGRLEAAGVKREKAKEDNKLMDRKVQEAKETRFSSKLKEKQKEKPIQDRFTDRDIEISVKVALECQGNAVKAVTELKAKSVNLETFRNIMTEFNEVKTSVVATVWKEQFRYNDHSLDDETYAYLILSRRIKLELVRKNQLNKPVEQRILDEHLEMNRQLHLAEEKDREHGFSTWLSENFERADMQSLVKIKEEMDALSGMVPCEIRYLVLENRLSDEQVKALALNLYMTATTSTSKAAQTEEVEEESEPPSETNTFSVASSMLKEKQKEKPIQDRFTDRDIEISVKVALECHRDGVKLFMMLNTKRVKHETYLKIMDEVNEMKGAMAATAFKDSFQSNGHTLDDDSFATIMLSRRIQLEMVKENQLDKPVEQRIADEYLEDTLQIQLAMEKDRQHGFSTWLSQNYERANLEALGKIKKEMDGLNGTVPYEVRLEAALVKREKAKEGKNVEPCEPDERLILANEVVITMLKENQKRKPERDRFTDEQIESVSGLCEEMKKDPEDGMLFWAAKQKNLDMEVATKIVKEYGVLNETKAFELRFIEACRVKGVQVSTTQPAAKNPKVKEAPEAVGVKSSEAVPITTETMIARWTSQLKEGQKKKPVKKRFTDVQIEKFGKFALEWQTDQAKASKMVEAKGWNRLDRDTIVKLREEMEVLRTSDMNALKAEIEENRKAEAKKEEEARQMKEKMGGEGNGLPPVASEVATAKNKKNKNKNKKTNNKTTSEVEVEAKVEAAVDVKTSEAKPTPDVKEVAEPTSSQHPAPPDLLWDTEEMEKDVEMVRVHAYKKPEGERICEKSIELLGKMMYATKMDKKDAEMWKKEKKGKGKTECKDLESSEEEEEQEEKVEKKKKRKKRLDEMTEEELEAKMNRMLKKSLAPLRNPLFIICMIFTLVYSAIKVYDYCEWLVHLIW